MSEHKTITLEPKLSFREALQSLEDGKCLGIRPDGNCHYVELFRPKWKRSGFQLRWQRTDQDSSINTAQFLGEWQLVILDHRELIKLPIEP